MHCTNAGNSATCSGIEMDGGHARKHIRNNCVAGTTHDGTGNANDYTDVSSSTRNNNISEDATADGTDSHASETEDFVSSTAPFDLHINASWTNAIDGGEDMVGGATTYNGTDLEFDIDFYDRELEATYDIGADQQGLPAGGAVSFVTTIAAVSTVTPVIHITRHFATTIAAQSTVTPTIHITRHFSTTVAAQSTVTSTDLNVSSHFVTTVAAQSTVTPVIHITRHLAATVAAQSTVTPVFRVIAKFNATVAGQSTVGPMVLTIPGGPVTRHFVTTVAAQSTVTPVIHITRHIAVAVAGQSTVTPVYRVIAKFNTTVGVQSAVGPMVLTVPTAAVTFVATVSAQSTVTPVFHLFRRFSTAISSQSTVSAGLTLIGVAEPDADRQWILTNSEGVTWKA